MKTTGAEKVVYVGNSQGTLIGFAGFSTYPEIAEKVKLFIALAPVAKVSHVKGALKLLAPFAKSIETFVEVFGSGEFLPRNEIITWLGRAICGYTPVEGDMCANIIFLVAGPIKVSFYYCNLIIVIKMT